MLWSGVSCAKPFMQERSSPRTSMELKSCALLAFDAICTASKRRACASTD